MKLKNALDAFTSYSTHFVVMAARSTETARAFTQQSNNRETLDAIDKVKALGEVVPYSTARSGEDVYLVMDTRRFSQFTVESMKYDVLINGLTAGQSHANLATTIEMTVLDSVGISFINFMQWLMDTKLQTNFDGMIFLIRVIFVGHNSDGTTQTVQAVTIPAYLFKMEVNLDFSKGVYNLEFMPNMNFSVFQHKRWLHIGKATSFSTIGSKTLQSVVKAFEDRLNEESLSFYNATSPILLRAGRNPQNTGSQNSKFGRLVKYQITLPDGWGDKEFFGSWKHNVNSSEERDFVKELQKLDAAKTPAQKQNAKPTDGTKSPAKDVSSSVPVGITITEVLDIIFRQVPAIAEFANSEKVSKTDGLIKFYKHVVSLTSTNDVITVHVDVVAFEVPNAQPPKKKTGEEVSQHQQRFYRTVKENGQSKNIPANYFELDYIFTGKNTQVLNFDMKIQDLQFLLASNVRVSEGELFAVKEDDAEISKEKLPEVLTSMRPYDPFLIPMKTELEKSGFSEQSANSRDPQANFEVSRSFQQYSRNLSAFYAASPIQVAMTIKGNPDIMLKFSNPNIAPSAEQTIETAQTSSITDAQRQQYRQQFEREILNSDSDTRMLTKTGRGTFLMNPQLGNASYMTTPVFVKLNVKGPNVDFRTNELIEGENFTKDVLYDNYYVVFKVTNIIERGVFTQQLELWSHNVFGSNKISRELVDARTTVRQ